jgi:hypothetical protein
LFLVYDTGYQTDGLGLSRQLTFGSSKLPFNLSIAKKNLVTVKGGNTKLREPHEVTFFYTAERPDCSLNKEDPDIRIL